MTYLEDWGEPTPEDVCLTCGGDGEIGINSEEGPEECPDCGGTGIEGHQKCHVCGGSGDDPVSVQMLEAIYGPDVNVMPCTACDDNGNVPE